MQPLLISFICALLLTSDPNFTAQVLDDDVSIGYGLAIGDVDGDGKPDILLADKKEFVWYRNGDWKRFVMTANLTEADNVCIAARDIDGDGKVEVAVGAQWNPGETSDPDKSGSVHYLVRPDDLTREWKPVVLPHEPTVHRMQWVKAAPGKFHLVMLPLHGRGNKDGEGNPVRVMGYEMPDSATGTWKTFVLDESMHLTHNFDVVPSGNSEDIYVGGKEGVKVLHFRDNKWTSGPESWKVREHSVGEVRVSNNNYFITGIEPMHGNQLTVYGGNAFRDRTLLTDDLKQGHALATGDLLNLGRDQVIAGWREPNSENKVGIKIFVAQDQHSKSWKSFWVDENEMACEDLKIADLNNDGKPDIIAAGRASHNLIVYWNKN